MKLNAVCLAAVLLTFAIVSPSFARERNFLIASKDHKVPSGEYPVGVLVGTSRQISKGEKIQRDEIWVVAVEERKIPSGTYRDPREVIGKIAKFDLAIGQLISSWDVEEPGAKQHTVEVVLDQSSYDRLQALALKRKMSAASVIEALLKAESTRSENGSKPRARR